MELYHIHLIGNHDRLYKEHSEFTIDKDKFNNRIYNRIYNSNATVDINKYKELVEYLNKLLTSVGMPTFDKRINLGEIIELVLKTGTDQENLVKILEDAKKIILADGINLREQAMEEYRKENCISLPSRLHSLFACGEEGLDFWSQHIIDNDVDVFKIKVYDEPFLSNEALLPSDILNYGEKVESSYNYFHPQKEDLNPLTDEYLVQGKVKILEKVMEVRN